MVRNHLASILTQNKIHVISWSSTANSMQDGSLRLDVYSYLSAGGCGWICTVKMLQQLHIHRSATTTIDMDKNSQE